MQAWVQRNRIFLLHLSFWAVYFSFFLYQILSYGSRRGQDPDVSEAIIAAVMQIAFMMSVSYLNYFLFLPRFLAKKQVWRYLAELIVPFTLLVIGYVHLKRFQIDGYTYHEHYFYSERFVVQIVINTLFILIFVGMLRFAEDWFELEARKKEVENEKLMAELRFLKAQINPHFLFNTLNNLYYLAFNQSPQTTEVISKLSQMMRYMIYDSNHPNVLLSKELAYMENYIGLEKLRLNYEVPITFTQTGKVEEVRIVPLIFITFLENAFKHGVSNNATKSWIEIAIDVRENQCFYRVANSKLPATKSVDAPEKSGIGLVNVRRRLELSYPGNYHLEVVDLPESYEIELTLNLA